MSLALLPRTSKSFDLVIALLSIVDFETKHKCESVKSVSKK